VTGKDIHVRGRALTRIRHSGNAEPSNPPKERAAAARTVASNAIDAADCAELLDMLGLDPGEGRTTCQG
jgi:hypothetical protein